MQSIDELAHVITELDPSDQQALLDKVAQLNIQRAPNNGADKRVEIMREAIGDELFVADLREVMEDFRHADSEETPA